MDWRLGTVALVVVFAGCSSITDGHPPTDTVTPVPVPTVSDEAEPEESLPPGVAGNSVVDADELVDAHLRAIRDRSYTLRVGIDWDDERTERIVQVETASRYYRHDGSGDSGGNVTAFADGRQLYVRDNRTGSSYYNRGNVTDPPDTPTIRLARLFLNLDDVTVAKTLVDDKLHYEIRGSGDRRPQGDMVRNYTVRALVAPNGLIRSMNASYTNHRNGAQTDVTYRIRYRAIGTTTVERPDWVVREWNDTEPSFSGRTGVRTTGY